MGKARRQYPTMMEDRNRALAEQELREQAQREWETGRKARCKVLGPPPLPPLSCGTKHDDGKLRWDLLMLRAVRGVVEILTYGAVKYADRNWEKGIKFSRLFAAAMRHISAFWLGEERDRESQLLHLDHAICDLMMIRELQTLHPEMDDRPKVGPQPGDVVWVENLHT